VRKISDEKVKQIIKLRKEGLSVYKIAETVGVHPTTVESWLKKTGNFGHPLHKTSPETIKKIIALYKKGLSCRKIAEKLKIDQRVVWKYLEKAGFKLNRYWLKPPSVKIPKDKTKLAYFAGLVDGEGYISLCKQSDGKYLTPYLAITNTSENLMEWLEKNFAKHHYKIHVKRQTTLPSGKKITQKHELVWLTNRTTDVYVLLKAILPFLVIKRKQAEKVLEVLEKRIKRARIMPPLGE